MITDSVFNLITPFLVFCPQFYLEYNIIEVLTTRASAKFCLEIEPSKPYGQFWHLNFDILICVWLKGNWLLNFYRVVWILTLWVEQMAFFNIKFSNLIKKGKNSVRIWWKPNFLCSFHLHITVEAKQKFCLTNWSLTPQTKSCLIDCASVFLHWILCSKVNTNTKQELLEHTN